MTINMIAKKTKNMMAMTMEIIIIFFIPISIPAKLQSLDENVFLVGSSFGHIVCGTQ